MGEDLITIVVPVYKVEKYLDKCVRSITNQTYKNLEIILVDDGSPDRCGEMCDRFAEADNRIRVIHKANGGLSDARNVGIAEAKGKYIGFVDSDDYIVPQMYEILYKNLIDNNADISACDRLKIGENEEKNADIQNNPIAMSSRDGIKDLFGANKYFWNAAWDKLYKIELFEDICYPKSRLYEDAATTYRLFERCSRVVSTKAQLYYYVQRDGSIMRSNYNAKGLWEQFENRIIAFDHFSNDTELQQCAFRWITGFAYPNWKEAHNNGDKYVAMKIKKEIRERLSLKSMRLLPIKHKIKMLLFIINPNICARFI